MKISMTVKKAMIMNLKKSLSSMNRFGMNVNKKFKGNKLRYQLKMLSVLVRNHCDITVNVNLCVKFENRATIHYHKIELRIPV